MNVSSLTSLAIKGPVNLTSDDRSQNVFAGKSDQNITTGAGNDFIASGAGDDTISSGRGIDRISAGAGDDTVHVDYVYDDSYISYDASNKQFIFDNGTDALTVNDAEKFIFTGSVEKNLTDLAVIGTKNFDPMGSIEVAGILNVGQTLTLKSSVTDSNGIDDEFLIENNIGLLVWKASNFWQSKLRKILTNYNLSLNEYLILKSPHNHPRHQS